MFVHYSVLLLIKITMFTWAVYESINRIADHRHHPVDVISGACIALIATTILVSLTLLNEALFVILTRLNS